MADLAQKFVADNLHVVDLPYRLSSWALDEAENIAVWYDDERELAAWAFLQTPFWTFDIVCIPSLELYQEILAWADRRAQQIIDGPFRHSP